jgi:hypothetical protein
LATCDFLGYSNQTHFPLRINNIINFELIKKNNSLRKMINLDDSVKFIDKVCASLEDKTYIAKARIE